MFTNIRMIFSLGCFRVVLHLSLYSISQAYICFSVIMSLDTDIIDGDDDDIFGRDVGTDSVVVAPKANDDDKADWDESRYRGNGCGGDRHSDAFST
jgi:hypothetical protein